MAHTAGNAGVIFVAAGKSYAERAAEAALSVKETNPWLPVTLFTDQGSVSNVFSSIVRFDDGHSRSKVDNLYRTPYDRTLYLDTDTRVVADLRPMFDLLERFDIAVCHAHRRNDDLTRESWRVTIPEAFPQANGGVILFRRTQAVIHALKAWASDYREAGFSKDQVTLREILWTYDLKTYFLPPEYNVRYRKYLYLWGRREAEPKILHFKRYHRPKRFRFLGGKSSNGG